MQYQNISEYGRNQHGVITLDQLRQFHSRKEIRTMIACERIRVIAGKVFAFNGSPDTWQQRMMAVQLWNPRALISHMAALHVYEFDSQPQKWAPQVEVTIPAGKSVRFPGVIVHQTDRMTPARLIDGFDVTNPARTVIDVAHLVTAKQLERFLENALHKRMITFEQIRSEIEAIQRRGRRGVGVMRELLALYDPEDENGATRLEREFRREFVRLGMPAPEEQFEVWAEGSPAIS